MPLPLSNYCVGVGGAIVVIKGVEISAKIALMVESD